MKRKQWIMLSSVIIAAAAILIAFFILKGGRETGRQQNCLRGAE